MKTNYSPKYIKRESTLNTVLYFIKDYTTSSIAKLGRIKILLLPALLIATAGNAQMIVANDNVASIHTVNGNPSNIQAVQQEVPLKSGAVITVKNIVKAAPEFIPNNEDKARAMVNDYFRGVDDADDNYKAKKSGKGAIITSTLIGGPIVGIIPTIVCSAAVPNNKNLNVPHSANVTNSAYMRGFRNEAHYIKRHNTWPRFVLASVVWLAIINIIAH